ncbi:MAG: hypothetical protein DDT33_01367 [Firmicutes bacterium]|nr:hypothetical protein [Bacillota bacterium]
MSLKSQRKASGTYNTPLRKFRAHFDGYDVQERKGQFAKEGQRDVLLNFSNLQVLETDSPYIYNKTQLILKFSDSVNSGWTLFEDSIATALSISLEDVSIDHIVGLDVTMEREDDFIFFVDKQNKESKGIVWRVIEAGGKRGTISSFDRALELLDGRSRGEFIGDAVADPVIQGDGILVNTILSGVFFEDARVKDQYVIKDNMFVKKIPF